MMLAKSVQIVCLCHIRKSLATTTESLLSVNSVSALRTPQDGSRFLSTSNVSRRRSDLDKLGMSPRDFDSMQKMGLEKYMKKHRQYAQFNYQEWRYPQTKRAIDISCTMGVGDKDVQEEGKAKETYLNQPRKKLNRLREETMSSRAIKKKVSDFHRKRFPAQAQEIYTKTHDLLNTKNWTITEKEKTEDSLHTMVTEFAYQKMIEGLDTKTVNWKFVESIEAPRVVRVLVTSMIKDDNTYAQVTVRFHTKQLLSIYDRFGRFMHGSPDVPRNVLEYVVFERHLANPYGTWRVHAKLPSNVYEREPVQRTVAVMQPNQKRAENKRWHEEEEKVHKFKWYPEREYLIWKTKSFERIRTASKYWKNIRKRRANSLGSGLRHIKKGSGLKRMRGKAQQATWRKQAEVLEARRIGKLPYPPRNDGES